MRHADRRSIDLALWAAQWMLAVVYELAGLIKLGLRASDMHHLGLFADATTTTLHLIGALDVLVAVLVILPALLRVRPWLSTAAAIALGSIAVLGIRWPAFGVGTGIAAVNVALAALATFVAWGRLARVPVAPFDEADRADAPSGSLPWIDLDEPEETFSPITGPLPLGQVPSHP